jgi:hypothetical protein
MRLNIILQLIAFSILIVSCSKKLEDHEIPYHKKILILGYVGNYDEPASLDILQSVPIYSDKFFDVVTDAGVVLFEKNGESEINSYKLSFNTLRERYESAETNIAKAGHIYWVEISYQDKKWKSVPIAFNSPEPEIEIEYEEANGVKDYLVKVSSPSGIEPFSYIAGIQWWEPHEEESQGWSLEKSLSGYIGGGDYSSFYYYIGKDFFEDDFIKYRFSLIDDSYNPENNNSFYILQIPEEGDHFINNWYEKYDFNSLPYESSDFFSQMFDIPPSNLKGGFLDVSTGRPTKEVTGVFFPCNSYKIH